MPNQLPAVHETQDDILHKRGVVNPKVIDLIREENAPTSAVVLVLIEDRSWTENADHLEQLAAKLNSYLDYVLDGWLHSQYPQYQNMPVVFELHAKEAPRGLSQKLTSEFASFASTQGITFRILIDDAALASN